LDKKLVNIFITTLTVFYTPRYIQEIPLIDKCYINTNSLLQTTYRLLRYTY